MLASLTHAHPLVYMRGVKHQDLSNIIDFIYHGEAEVWSIQCRLYLQFMLQVRKEDLETFLSIAGELSVKGMTKQVSQTQSMSIMFLIMINRLQSSSLWKSSSQNDSGHPVIPGEEAPEGEHE